MSDSADGNMTLVDHNILVIVGAGASVNLANDGTSIPLMNEWAISLHEAIEAEISGAATLIGIVPDIEGLEFEKRLGGFLAFQRNLGQVDAYSGLGFNPIGARTGDWAAWFNATTVRCNQIVEAIRKNLFESFGLARLDVPAATSAYDTLQTWLRLRDADGRTERQAFATTNYDCAIEQAFDNLTNVAGRPYDVRDGFRPRYGKRGTPILDPLGMSEAWIENEDVLPVVHLHGAVGWFVRDGLTTKPSHEDQPYVSGQFGAPALSLPDNTKTAASLVGVSPLWDEFRGLLRAASHIVFLGHSLHDEHILEAVRSAAKPTLVFEYVGGHYERTSTPAVPHEREDEIRQLLPGSTVVPGTFGPSPATNVDSVQAFLRTN